jgi:hypothetical protein
MKSKKDEKIITALLSFPTIREAADNLEMSESTIYNYLKDDIFRTKLNETKSGLLKQTTGYLQAGISKATENIIKLSQDEDINPQTRLNACKTALEYSIKLTEIVDVIPRIEALEVAQSTNK